MGRERGENETTDDGEGEEGKETPGDAGEDEKGRRRLACSREVGMERSWVQRFLRDVGG